MTIAINSPTKQQLAKALKSLGMKKKEEEEEEDFLKRVKAELEAPSPSLRQNKKLREISELLSRYVQQLAALGHKPLIAAEKVFGKDVEIHISEESSSERQKWHQDQSQLTLTTPKTDVTEHKQDGSKNSPSFTINYQDQGGKRQTISYKVDDEQSSIYLSATADPNNPELIDKIVGFAKEMGWGNLQPISNSFTTEGLQLLKAACEKYGIEYTPHASEDRTQESLGQQTNSSPDLSETNTSPQPS